MATTATPKPSFPPKALSSFFIKPPSSTRKNPNHPSFVPTLNPQSSSSSSSSSHNHTQPKTKTSSPKNKTQKARRLADLINRSPGNKLPPISSSLSLTKTSFLQTLRLIKTPSKTLHFFNWVKSKSKSNSTKPFPLPSRSLFLLLERLGRARWLNIARNLVFNSKDFVGIDSDRDRLFNSLIRSYGRAGLFNESIKVFEAMKSMGVSPSVVTFNSLLTVVMGRGRIGVACKVFDEMCERYGVRPDVCTFNVMIRGFCRCSRVEDGFRFFNEMRRFGCEPDLVTYNTLVDGLCRVGKVEIADNLVKAMLKKGLDFGPNVVTYTTLIRGYCVERDVARALVVFEEMVDRGLEPNNITYNTLVQGLCEVRRFDKIKELFNGAKGRGDFVPDTCTFNTLMIAHCNAGKFDEAMCVYRKFSDLQVQPDSASYSILIRALCGKGDFEKAEELYDELAEKEIVLHEKGSVPLSAAYNPMFEYLCANGKTKKAEKVFRQLMKRGTQDPPSFRTLILGHCREGTFVAGLRLLVLMLRRNFVPDYGTFLSLIKALLLNGEPILAYRTLGMMLRSSHIPEASTFQSLLSELIKVGHACESAEVMIEMLGRKIRQNINLSTQTVVLLFKNGMRNKAHTILGLLYDSGYLVRMEDVINYLLDFKKLLDAHEVLLLCLKKHEKVDTHICDTVITGLCDAQMIPEAFHLYYELVEKGVKQLNGLEMLVACLESVGKLKEAAFVSKRMVDPGSLGRIALLT